MVNGNSVLTEASEIERGIRQGDALSTFLFNLVLHATIGDLDWLNLIKYVPTAYADDVALIT